jgi:hypothetical protein
MMNVEGKSGMIEVGFVVQSSSFSVSCSLFCLAGLSSLLAVRAVEVEVEVAVVFKKVEVSDSLMHNDSREISESSVIALTEEEEHRKGLSWA